MSATYLSGAILPPSLPAAIVETLLTGLAALFLAGADGDAAAARDAAARMVASYHPRTEDELRLAANIVGFSFHALEALGQAAAPDLPMTRILRLRGSAVSLSRESVNAERRLTQLQKARQQPITGQIAEPEPIEPEPRIDRAIALVRDTSTIAATAKADGTTWTKAYDGRQREIRIAASIARAEARAAAHAIAASQTTAAMQSTA